MFLANRLSTQLSSLSQMLHGELPPFVSCRECWETQEVGRVCPLQPAWSLVCFQPWRRVDFAAQDPQVLSDRPRGSLTAEYLSSPTWPLGTPGLPTRWCIPIMNIVLLGEHVGTAFEPCRVREPYTEEEE